MDWPSLPCCSPGRGDVRTKLADCITKDDTKGRAYCEYCQKYPNYSGRGKATLLDHIKTPKHLGYCKVRLTNYGIGSYAATPKLKVCLFNKIFNFACFTVPLKALDFQMLSNHPFWGIYPEVS